MGTPNNIKQTLHTIPAAVDDFPLKLTTFESLGESTEVVIISPATGVPARFYNAFAIWLAQQGCIAITFDYRLCGISFPPGVDVSNEDARVEALISGKDTSISEHWGRRDQRAVIQFAHKLSNGRPVILVGHSVGGHIAPLSTENNALVTRFLFISVQAPFYGYYDDPTSQRDIWQTIKSFIENAGYLKGSDFGLGNDIPAAAGLDWQRWCSMEKYIGGEETKPYNSFSKPVLSIGFQDDLLSTRIMFDKYLETLPQSNSTWLWIDPAKQGWGEIGHINFFKERNKHVWPMALDWIRNEKIPTDVGERKNYFAKLAKL